MIPSRDELKYAGVELHIRRLAAELDRTARPHLLARLAGDIRVITDPPIEHWSQAFPACCWNSDRSSPARRLCAADCRHWHHHHEILIG